MPKNTGRLNFDAEYDTKSKIFMGLVQERNLDVLRHYGGHVLLFDLEMLDDRDDYFVNVPFTGEYVYQSAARRSDGQKHMDEIFQAILEKGSHEVVFTDKIEFKKTAPVKIHVFGDPPEHIVKSYHERLREAFREIDRLVFQTELDATFTITE